MSNYDQVKKLQAEVDEHEAISYKYFRIVIGLAAYMVLVGLFGEYILKAPDAVIILVIALYKTIPIILFVYYMPILVYRTIIGDRRIRKWEDAVIDYRDEILDMARIVSKAKAKHNV